MTKTINFFKYINIKHKTFQKYLYPEGNGKEPSIFPAPIPVRSHLAKKR